MTAKLMVGTQKPALLTVIVPIGNMAGRLHNLESWLPEAIALNLEIVLVHDDKKDSTGIELKKILSKNKSEKIRVITGEFLSPGAARNQGLVEVKTRWFAFWDADDLPVVSEFVSMILEAQDANKYVVQGQYRASDTNSGDILRFSTPKIDNWNIRTAQNPGLWRFGFLSEQFLHNTFPEISMGEDQVYLASLKINSEVLSVSKKIVYEYFVGSENQLTSPNNSVSDLIHARARLLMLIRQGQGRECELAELMLMKQQVTIIRRRGRLIHRLHAISFLARFMAINPRSKINKFWKLMLVRNSLAAPNMIYLQGGLGNQLFQMSALLKHSQGNPCIAEESLIKSETAKSIQEIFNNSKEYYQLQFQNYKLNKFRVKYLNLSLRLSAKISTKNGKLNNSLLLFSRRIMQSGFRILDTRRKLVISQGLGFDPQMEMYDSNTLFIGYFQSEKYAIAIRDSMRTAMKNLIKKNKFLKSLQESSQDLNSLVVQVRLGDYVKNPRFGKLSPEYFRKAIALAEDGREFDNFWIFSNEVEKAQRVISRASDTSFQSPVSEAHTDLENLAAISLGNVFVISNSTFGWWGAFLSESGLRNGTVYFPEPWFKSIDSPYLLVPAAWAPVHSFDL